MLILLPANRIILSGVLNVINNLSYHPPPTPPVKGGEWRMGILPAKGEKKKVGSPLPSPFEEQEISYRTA